jgi:hypothetical protein
VRPPATVAWRALSLVATFFVAFVALRVAPAVAATAQIHTFAGRGDCAGAVTSGGPCDDVAADSVPISFARSVAELPDGGFLYADYSDHVVREVSASGIVSTVAGNGTTSDAPDGTLAVNSGLNGPVAVAPLPGGGFLVTEYNGSVVRVVSPGTPATATITTIAGIGAPFTDPGFTGVATAMALNYPTDAEPTPDGRVLIADTYDNYVRIVSAPTSGATMTAVAGGGSCNDVTGSCDGQAAGAVALDHPVSVSPLQDGSGGYLIAEYDGAAIRKVSGLSQFATFTTVAGTPGRSGFGGDGGPATAAQLDHPEGVASTAGGGFLVADTNNNRIRAVSPSGTITTVAGSTAAGFAGDGAAADAASLLGPAAISPTPDGGFLIADAHNDAVRAVTIPPTSTIALQPAAPNGMNGWYVRKVHVTVSAVNAVQTRCEVDPLVVPPVLDVIPPSCPLSGGGADITLSGPHTLYAASADSAGDEESPVTTSLKLDSVPPKLTCTGASRFAVHARGKRVSASVTDADSGPAAAVVTAPARTTTVGSHTANVVGADKAGNATRQRCPYTVLPVTLAPTPSLAWTFSVSRRNATVKRLVVTEMPSRARVELSCRGVGCPFSSVHNLRGSLCSPKRCAAHSPTRVVDLASLFAGHRLATNTKIAVAVTEPNTIGRLWRITIRSAKAPVQRIACVVPASWVPKLVPRSRCVTSL